MTNKSLLLVLLGVFLPLFIFVTYEQYKNIYLFIPYQIGTIILETGGKPNENKSSAKPRSITFVGDVMMARNVEFLIDKNGSDYPYRKLDNFFATSTPVVANFESAIASEHRRTPSGIMQFSVDSDFLPAFNEAGFTHLSLANNHTLDFGELDLKHTQDKLAENNFTTFGQPNMVDASSVTIIELENYKVGIIGINLIYFNPDFSEIENQIASLETTTDYQIVYIHWGDEYILKHNKSQEDFAKRLIDKGVDAIIGMHPHVVQDIQIYSGKPIFYSLGNFIFDQYFSVDVQQGLALNFVLSSSTALFEIIPVSSEGSKSQPYLMPEEQKIQFLTNLARRSSPEYNANIKAGLLILPFTLATSN